MPVTVSGLDAAKARIQGMADRLKDLTPVLQVAAADTVTLVDDSFRGSVSPDGAPWRPLSEATLVRRRGGTATILNDTSRLRGSITATGSRSSLRFGTNVEYAKPNQFGATRSGTLKRRSYKPRRDAGTPWITNLPARPFLPVMQSGGRVVLMTTGRAGEHWSRVRENVKHYILTGEVR